MYSEEKFAYKIMLKLWSKSTLNSALLNILSLCRRVWRYQRGKIG